ncbi:unnamed protein product [Ranitomeya imitator]|uniref:EGF-like domain-containing protein n=1 Tax=Ranitomeya imitator TaxID=111125 RepID=A0ABN9MFM9_9NEOB|nr:unnamed protein product [Ranitomeya imitator]
MVVDDEEKANILNTFFSTVFTVENEMLGEIPRNNENPILRVTNLTQEEVRNRLNKIKIDKSPGPDGIHPRVLRELTTGSVPQDWRIANVVPIFKKGSKSEPGNYRPDIVPVYQIKGISKLFKLCLPKVQCFCDSLTSPPSERQFNALLMSVASLLANIVGRSFLAVSLVPTCIRRNGWTSLELKNFGILSVTSLIIAPGRQHTSLAVMSGLQMAASVPLSKTHWDNFTTGLGQVYITGDATIETLNVTNNETSSNFTIRPEQDFITSDETPDTSLEMFPSNVTAGLHVTNISQDTNGRPNSTPESLLNNTPTEADLSYINQETIRSPNITLQSHPENVTSGPHLTYMIEETSEIPNSTLETFPNNVTTGANVSYITEETSRAPNSSPENYSSNVTTGPDLAYITEEASRAPNTSPENYPSNVTTGPDLTYITEETSRALNSSPENYPSNVTTGPHLAYITVETSRALNISPENYPKTSRAPNSSPENYSSNVTTGPHSTSTTQYTSGTSTSTLEPYPNNATTRPNMSYISEETSITPSTTTEKYQSNVTSGSHLTYITEETSRTSNTTLFVPNNGTTAGDLIYTNEEPSRTINNVHEFFFNVTSGSDLTSLMVVTVRTLNNTLEQLQSNVTTDPGLVYLREKTTGTPNTSLEMDRTSYPDIINSLDLIDTITDAPTTWTSITSVQTGGTFFISAVHCFQDADCPPYSMCSLQGALHICQCHLGYFFHQDLGCVAARTFPARIPISVLSWDETSGGGDIGDEIRHMEAAQYDLGVHRVRMLFQDVFDHIPGYVSTSITDVQLDEGHVTIVHSFSTLYPVTEEDVWRALTVSPIFCDDPHGGCASALTRDNYQGLSLCDFDVCDFSSSDCHVHGGLVTCECRRGYYKFSPTDRSCRECGSGYRRTESGCERSVLSPAILCVHRAATSIYIIV